jgi:hypothetical protein
MYGLRQTEFASSELIHKKCFASQSLGTPVLSDITANFGSIPHACADLIHTAHTPVGVNFPRFLLLLEYMHLRSLAQHVTTSRSVMNSWRFLGLLVLSTRADLVETHLQFSLIKLKIKLLTRGLWSREISKQSIERYVERLHSNSSAQVPCHKQDRHCCKQTHRAHESWILTVSLQYDCTTFVMR